MGKFTLLISVLVLFSGCRSIEIKTKKRTRYYPLSVGDRLTYMAKENAKRPNIIFKQYSVETKHSELFLQFEKITKDNLIYGKLVCRKNDRKYYRSKPEPYCYMRNKIQPFIATFNGDYLYLATGIGDGKAVYGKGRDLNESAIGGKVDGDERYGADFTVIGFNHRQTRRVDRFKINGRNLVRLDFLIKESCNTQKIICGKNGWCKPDKKPYPELCTTQELVPALKWSTRLYYRGNYALFAQTFVAKEDDKLIDNGEIVTGSVKRKSPPRSTGQGDAKSRLEKLKKLYKNGLIDKGQYDKKVENILEDM